MQTVEIVKALRCTSAPGAEERHCEACPFCVKEVLDAEYTALYGGGEIDACDCDAVGNLAADRLEELLERCARYAEEIAMLRERQRWMPVTERLPEVWRNDETAELVNYMIYSPDFGVDIGNYHAKAKNGCAWLFPAPSPTGCPCRKRRRWSCEQAR